MEQQYSAGLSEEGSQLIPCTLINYPLRKPLGFHTYQGAHPLRFNWMYANGMDQNQDY